MNEHNRNKSATRREFDADLSRECTFRPKINKRRLNSFYLPPSESSLCRMKEKEIKISVLKSQVEHKFMSYCTFSPQINRYRAPLKKVEKRQEVTNKSTQPVSRRTVKSEQIVKDDNAVVL